jgi:hypothetical protein
MTSTYKDSLFRSLFNDKAALPRPLQRPARTTAEIPAAASTPCLKPSSPPQKIAGFAGTRIHRVVQWDGTVYFIGLLAKLKFWDRLNRIMSFCSLLENSSVFLL